MNAVMTFYVFRQRGIGGAPRGKFREYLSNVLVLVLDL
jgi:hypothetical protein